MVANQTLSNKPLSHAKLSSDKHQRRPEQNILHQNIEENTKSRSDDSTKLLKELSKKKTDQTLRLKRNLNTSVYSLNPEGARISVKREPKIPLKYR